MIQHHAIQYLMIQYHSLKRYHIISYFVSYDNIQCFTIKDRFLLFDKITYLDTMPYHM